MKARYWPCVFVKPGAEGSIDMGADSRSCAFMNVRYRVRLNDDERDELKALLAKGKRSARRLKRAQILLASDAGESDEAIASNVGVGTSTVFRTKRRFVEGNLEHALEEEKRPGAKRKLSGKEEALLVATACATPPLGRARWTLDLLAGAMVSLTEHGDLSRETVRRRLGESKLKPWRQEMWCIPVINGEYVARMEHVLDLYAEAHDPRRPVVCFDESPTQLIGEVRLPIAAKPGQLQRYDSEYVRHGTVNLFMFIDAHRRWRHVKLTERRTALDFAECMRDLVDVHYPTAELVRVVLDNLSTHVPGALYEAFEPEEARRILRRLELHFVPKHGSWLNMAEIEIGVLRGQCIDRRIDDAVVLGSEIAAWEKQRNEAKATIEWTFTTQKAREKMGRAYPKTSASAPNAPAVVNPIVAPIIANSTPALADPTPLTASLTAASTASAVVVPVAPSPTAVANAPKQSTQPKPAAPMAKRQRKLTSRGPRCRFKARPTLPRRRPQRNKPKKQPVKITVRSY
jgi:transposase